MRLVVLGAVCLVGGCDGLFGLTHINEHADDDAAAVGDAVSDGRPVDAMTDSMPDAYVNKTCPMLGYGLMVSGGSTTYYRNGGAQKTWIAAAIDCQDDAAPQNVVHTHLVVLGSDLEASNVYSAVLGSSAPGGFWVGLSDRITSSNFKWVTNEPTAYPGAAMAAPWDTNQPDGSGDCVVDSTVVRMDDVNCTESHYFACECDAWATNPNNF